jgi:Leucine-rich repeat (LRR) protein
MMVRVLIFGIWICSMAPVRAQLLSRLALDSTEAFTDINAALKNPEQVYSLDLSGQRLKEVPRDITKFINLNILDLSRNRIKEVPDFIAENTFLQELRLSKNRLKDFPGSICGLTNLDHLDLGKNNIDSIPPCIGQLEHLRVLDLWGNYISALPTEMSDLRSLRFMDLRVMVLSFDEIDAIVGMVPWAKVYYSEPCNCN